MLSLFLGVHSCWSTRNLFITFCFLKKRCGYLLKLTRFIKYEYSSLPEKLLSVGKADYCCWCRSCIPAGESLTSLHVTAVITDALAVHNADLPVAPPLTTQPRARRQQRTGVWSSGRRWLHRLPGSIARGRTLGSPDVWSFLLSHVLFLLSVPLTFFAALSQ